MEKEKIDQIFDDNNKLLESCKNLEKEMDAMKQGVDFLINEYKTNKRWFKTHGDGRVTTEDVIRACFEFGWSSKSMFDYENNKENK